MILTICIYLVFRPLSQHHFLVYFILKPSRPCHNLPRPLSPLLTRTRPGDARNQRGGGGSFNKIILPEHTRLRFWDVQRWIPRPGWPCTPPGRGRCRWENRSIKIKFYGNIRQRVGGGGQPHFLFLLNRIKQEPNGCTLNNLILIRIVTLGVKGPWNVVYWMWWSPQNVYGWIFNFHFICN